MGGPFLWCSSGAHLPRHARSVGDVGRGGRVGGVDEVGAVSEGAVVSGGAVTSGGSVVSGGVSCGEGGRLVGRRRHRRGRRLRRRGRRRVGGRLIDGRRRLLLRRLRRRGCREGSRASVVGVVVEVVGVAVLVGTDRDRSGAALSPCALRTRRAARQCVAAHLHGSVIEGDRSVHYLHEIGELHREPSLRRRSRTMSGPTPTCNESGRTRTSDSRSRPATFPV